MLSKFKEELEQKRGTNCCNCSLRQANPVPHGQHSNYTVYQYKEVIILGGDQLDTSRITRLVRVCELVYGKGNVSYWPAHICLKVGAKKLIGAKELVGAKEACAPLTERLLKNHPNVKVVVASKTSFFKEHADIIIEDNLFTEKSYATLRFRLTYHKVNGYRFPDKPTQYTVLSNKFNDGEELFNHWIDNNSIIALDTETNTLYPFSAGAFIVLIQLTGPAKTISSTTWEKTETIVVDLTVASINNYPTLKKLLTTNIFVLHNATFDVNFIKKCLDIEVNVYNDTMLMGHLCKEVRPHALTKYYANEVLGWGDYDTTLKSELKHLENIYEKDGRLIKADHKNNPVIESPNYTDIPRTVLYEYAALDTQATWSLIPTLELIIKQDKLEKMNETYKTMRCGLGLIQRRGVYVDKQRLEWLDTHIYKKLKTITSQYRFNLASPKQVAEFIFDELGLEERKSRKWGKRSVKEAALAHLVDNYHVRQIMKARTLSKMRGTYTQGFLASMYPNNTIMPVYNIISAKTGRISASNPPLQTIPRPFKRVIDGYDLGAVIRSCVCRPFVGANPHHTLWYNNTNDWETEHRGTIVAGDLSQAELRILAELSGSKFFTMVYQEGRDLHTEVAASLFGETFTKANKKEKKRLRSIAKGLNFGFAYGGNLEVLAIEAGATPQLAKQAAAKFKSLTKDYTIWKEGVADQIFKTGRVQSPMGRVRRWYNPTKRYEILKQGPNSLIQGFSSDITNLAAAKLALEGYKVFLLWHDGIYIYADKGEEYIVKEALKSALLGTFREYVKNIPVKMDIDISPRIYMFGEKELT